MKNFYLKPNFWKGTSDLVILIFFLGFFLGIITPGFYKWAIIFIIPGLISTIWFLLKQIFGGQDGERR